VQAFDDILWVVLSNLEAINFIQSHSKLYYPTEFATAGSSSTPLSQGLWDSLNRQAWYGNSWIASFSHRARIFWELATKGWDTDLCDGGMTWNPRLQPYKNAITNELWVAASIQMYLNFPGDNITSPWQATGPPWNPGKDPKHLAAAIEGYKWLYSVGMLNDHGLFADGFHISGKHGKKCDSRDEMVYTYNQGVILTGQRGLWTATGSASYLEDGHRLIQAVINATGFDLKKSRPKDNLDDLPPGNLPPWHGLGRGGVIEEQCDASGTCSQNGHTFKGNFFHHLTHFCSPMATLAMEGHSINQEAFEKIASAHDTACHVYTHWLEYNAKAALGTRNSKGQFGMWWGAGIFSNTSVTEETDGIPRRGLVEIDYRNYGIPEDQLWSGEDVPPQLPGTEWKPSLPALEPEGQHPLGGQARKRPAAGARMHSRPAEPFSGDPNDRGRGRTVETQHSAMSLLRALWEISQASKSS
jgi:hypothetical protein